MKRKISLMFLIAAGFLPAVNKILAQDGFKVVILSTRVGPEIDKSESNYFHLFKFINGFNRAVFYQTPQRTYFARIKLVGADSKMRDTTITYPQNLLLILSEKINHFEELVKGKYQMGQNPGVLQVVGGEEIAQDTTLEEVVRKTISAELANPFPESTTAASRLPDILPLAPYTGKFKRESYPNWGFGIGASTYSPDFSKLEPAYTAIENKYRNQGYPMGHFCPNSELMRIFWYHMKIRFSRNFALLLETGSSVGGGDAGLKAVSASMLYQFRFVKTDWFRPYAGAGVSHTRFNLRPKYGNRISAYYGHGSYAYLDAVKSEGGKMGFTLTGGIEFYIQGAPSLSLYGNYFMVPAVETSTLDGGKASVNLSSIAAGARISIYF